MKNKFIKTICSFQIGVNIIGLPLYLELRTISKQCDSVFNKKDSVTLKSYLVV